MGVREKMRDDSDRGEGDSRKTMLIKTRAWSKLLRVVGVLVGEELGKIVE